MKRKKINSQKCGGDGTVKDPYLPCNSTSQSFDADADAYGLSSFGTAYVCRPPRVAIPICGHLRAHVVSQTGHSEAFEVIIAVLSEYDQL